MSFAIYRLLFFLLYIFLFWGRELLCFCSFALYWFVLSFILFLLIETMNQRRSWQKH
uniref:Candidate secreted effector n=1 Tax=Meloidogyne incognita TaxID=6306 RepID=A0A914LVY1_MELIC